jgi:uncharacterized protein
MTRDMPGLIIDSHVHIFPEKMMKAVFSYFEKRYDWKLPFSTNPDLLVEYLKKKKVDRAFTLAYTHKPGLSRSLNRWLADFCSKNPSLIPFGAVHPLDTDLEEVAAECLDLYHFPGMKLHCLVQQCRPDDEKLFPLYEAIIERSRGMIIHAGSFPQPAEEHLGIGYVAKLLKRFPTLNLIVPHLGLNDLPAYGELLDAYEGLFLDTAFVFQNRIVITPFDDITRIILTYPDRIIYGSDFPFILEPLENGTRRILDLELPTDLYKNLFYENAARFLARLS